MRSRLALAAAVLASSAGSPTPAFVLGGGPQRTDCWAAFDVVGAGGGNVVPCDDGDPNCDQDGIPDGVCRFRVRVCLDVPGVPKCQPRRIRRVRVIPPLSGDEPVLPTIGTSDFVCGDFTTVAVPVHRLRRKTLPGASRFRMIAVVTGHRKDHDRLRLACECSLRATCPQNPAGGPNVVTFTTADSGSDLDIGWTGIAHNFPFDPRVRVNFCLSGCDATTNPMCVATAAGAGNGAVFGPPLPLIAQGVPLCVINHYDGDPTGTINVQTGEVSEATPLAVHLFSDVHFTSASQVCPRCKGSDVPTYGGRGVCDGGPNQAQPCAIESIVNVAQATGGAVYPLSGDCPPQPSQKVSTVDIQLRLTTGTSKLTGSTPCKAQPGEPVGVMPEDDACNGSPCAAGCTGTACIDHTPNGECIDAKGGISQLCCNDSPETPCFPSSPASGAMIVRTGHADPPTPVWPDATYPKMSAKPVLVATFCHGATGASTIDGAAGLPGPAAIMLPVTEAWLASSSGCD